jgi:tRNA G18 (ribose-2'-O)-methylase SpoU
MPGLARAAGYPVIAADRGGTPLREFRFPEPAIVAVGHERSGLRGRLPTWDAAVAIPQPGLGESLNAAVAGSIVLYELALQRMLSRGLSTRLKP